MDIKEYIQNKYGSIVRFQDITGESRYVISKACEGDSYHGARVLRLIENTPNKVADDLWTNELSESVAKALKGYPSQRVFCKENGLTEVEVTMVKKGKYKRINPICRKVCKALNVEL